MKSKLSIVKIGGNIIEDSAGLVQFLQLFARLPNPKILVHGGGKRATEMANKMGVNSPIIGGRRITDEQGLDVVVMVYAGLLNKNITAQLQAFECNAIGMSGADANTILAHKRPVENIDYGYAGDVDSVSERMITKLLEAKLVPVFCALTHDGKGQLLNTNADTIASELAIGLSTAYDTTLYYCFEKKGVLRDLDDEQSLIHEINTESYKLLLEKKLIADGMLPKLENCFHALQKNVKKVCIGNASMLQPNYQKYTTLTL